MGFAETRKLDSVIEGCKTDIEIFKRLTIWSRKQFKPGNPDPYPMSNGLDILKDIRSGKTGGFLRTIHLSGS